MSLLIVRANPSNWVAGNLLTATQVNTLDTNPVTVAEYVESQRIDVKLYGAVGDDSTDDTSAIQDAADAAASTDTPLWFPPGRYRCSNILWGACNMYGVPNESFIRSNNAANPIFTSTTSHGVGASNYTARVVSGLSFKFVSATPSAPLIVLGGSNRVTFNSCFFDNTGSTLTSGSGALLLGSTGAITRVVMNDCSFVLTGAADCAIGYSDGSTYVTLNGCRFRVDSTARQELYTVVRAVNIKANNCFVDLSAATASVTYIRVFGGSITEQLMLTGVEVTACSSGTPWIMNPGVTCPVTDSGCSYPDTASLFGTGNPTKINVQSRKRHAAVTQSGGGSQILDTYEYDSFMVTIGDNTDFTMSARAAPIGTEFDLMLRRSGSPSGTITWSTSIFEEFGTVGGGYGMPVALLAGQVASGRFRRATTSSGDRWVLVGSGALYT